MEKKLAVYICKGCGIGDIVDADTIIKAASSTTKVPAAQFKSHDALCGADGLNMIKADIAAGANTIVIGACSPRVKYDEFDFPGCIVERAGVRELAIWSQPKPDDKTPEHYHPQGMANDYVSMSIFKAQKGDMPEPGILQDLSTTIMVIGGGFTGLSAALDAAKAGYDVVVVEKEKELGGWAAKLWKQAPMEYPFEKLEEPGVFAKIKEAEANPKIKIIKSASVVETAGQPGLFDVKLSSGETIKIGSIVLAAGWKPYDASKLGHLGYGKPNVVTSVEFEDMAKKGKIKRPSDGKEAKRVAFIQCAGSRDANHLAYCSGFCCANSLKQAKYVRELNTDAVAMIFYKDIRTPGQTEFFYKNMQNDPGVMLTKAEVTAISDAPGGSLYVEAEQTLLGEKIKVEADLVVLATGIVPATAPGQQYLDGLAAASTSDDNKKKFMEANPQPEYVLNLTYRQGPEIPSLPNGYGFADSNFICFQYETRRTGIYAAGCVRSPMGMAEAASDASGAAFKAIQAMDHLAKGMAVHPRAWDTTFPEPLLQRCTACKRCTEECPFGAIEEDAKGIPNYMINRCRRCATCMGACPERIVSFKNYHVDMIGTMLKNVEVPDEGLRVIVLACENDAYPALDTLAQKGLQLHPAMRIIPVRCLGSTNLVWVADAFSRGIDGMLLLGCKFGENYQCHFVKGSELASYRFGKIQETLDRLQLEADRCAMLQVSIDEYDKLPDMANSFVKKIEDQFGPNPFKGF